MFKNPFKNRKKEEAFWDWFSRNASRYYRFNQNQSALFTELKVKLAEIHPDIVFEFSANLNNGIRELVISADGIKSIFPIVSNLVSKAPHLKNWKFTAFRQPRPDITQIKYQGLIINIDDVFFKYSKIAGDIDLELYIRGFSESPEWTAASFILLDIVLGEYYTTTRIGSIEKRALDEGEVDTLIPIRALAQLVEEHHSQLNN
ncbi:MAG TPA: hypothetical protein VD993_11850 [Chitinophagaceae bacterium]|nr:hypothetical protein [Chitinophagaceae bacterium]